MNKSQEIDVNLMIQFLHTQFPKKRIKARPKDRRFIPGIIIPPNFTNRDVSYLPIRTPSDMRNVNVMLHPILQRFFGADDESIDRAVFTYLGIF